MNLHIRDTGFKRFPSLLTFDWGIVVFSAVFLQLSKGVSRAVLASHGIDSLKCCTWSAHMHTPWWLVVHVTLSWLSSLISFNLVISFLVFSNRSSSSILSQSSVWSSLPNNSLSASLYWSLFVCKASFVITLRFVRCSSEPWATANKNHTSGERIRFRSWTVKLELTPAGTPKIPGVRADPENDWLKPLTYGKGRQNRRNPVEKVTGTTLRLFSYDSVTIFSIKKLQWVELYQDLLLE